MRFMKKCKGIGELTVMEVSQVVGVRTRAMTTALVSATKAGAKRRKAASSVSTKYQIAYLHLRNRRLMMTMPPQISRSGEKSSGSRSRRCPKPELSEISRCESNASCDQEAAELQSDDQEASVVNEYESGARYSSSSGDRELMPSSNTREQSYDLESTAERRSPRRSTAVVMPSDAEIDDFFAAAEKKEAQRFASTYNYDVVNDAPLEGRYEWVPVDP